MTTLPTTPPAPRVIRDPGKEFAEPEERTEDLIRTLAGQSAAVLVKKLSPNDRQWAVWDESKKRWMNNQAGPLLPAECWRRPKTDPLIGVVPIQN